MSIRLMVVDDDDSIREIIKVMLKDFEIIEASNGFEAIKLYERFHPEIVLMDVSMPQMDGVEATKEILKIDPKAVIIGLTAFARSRGKEMLQSGAKEVVEKPFTRKMLKEIIEKYASSALAET
ncbi:response regulator [Archaeoglobus neptunius]|uniref:response regulator n=1 Tax=Archaeoglobus neptunius TaxID=2798580 RepID=UPI0019282B75|nr:response regulator [Archaeoglobus neptunius]